MQPTSHPFAKRDFSHQVFAIGSIFFLVRIIGARWRAGFPLEFPDSYSYLEVSLESFWSMAFWFGDRPSGVPLLLSLFNQNTRIFILFQTILYAVAFSFICSIVLRVVRTRLLAWACCLSIFAIGIQPRFSLWNTEILSESLGLSLSLFAMGTWLLVSQRITKKGVIAATAFTIIWMMTRDTHLVPVVFLVATLIVVSYHKRKSEFRKVLFTATGVLVLALSYSIASQSVGNRNFLPLINTVGKVILPDSKMTDYFVSQGMPDSETLRDMAGRDSWSDGEMFLKDPSLADFRSWANNGGQETYLRSLVERADFWVPEVRQDVDQMLRHKFHDYDRFTVRDRLPENLFGVTAIQTGWQFWFLLATAVGSLVVLALFSRRKYLVLAVAVGLIASIAELYISLTGDAVEFQRHLVGPILRVLVLCLLAISLFLDSVIWPEEKVAVNRIQPSLISRVNVFAWISSMTAVLAAWFASEYRSQDFDPQFARTLVERVASFGGSYYQNALHNKGPLEAWVYSSARWFTTYDTYWFAIAFYILVIAVVLAMTAALVSRYFGASRVIAMCCASLVLAHFYFAASDYSSVLYSRNISTGLLAGVFGIILTERFWVTPTSARNSLVIVAVLLGLTVQTMVTSALAAAVLGLVALLLRKEQITSKHPYVLGATISVSTVLAMPLWYFTRGTFNEFWSGWWTYASFMSKATNRPLLQQIKLGRHEFYQYYDQRPILLLALVGSLAVFYLYRDSLSPRKVLLLVALIGWWGTGWVELIVSQRYSSHYFAVIAVPSAFIFAAAVSILLQSFVERREAHQGVRVPMVLPVILCSILIGLQGTDSLFDGLSRLGRFTSFASLSQEQRDNRGEESQTVQNIVDLVSPTNGAMLAWTMYPWTYLNYQRVPATRFGWKSFMVGEIYLGSTSPKYILPDTWRWFAEDMKQTDPQVFLRPLEIAPEYPPTFDAFVMSEFSRVATSAKIDVHIRKSELARLLAPITTSEILGMDERCYRISGLLRSTDYGTEEDRPRIVLSDSQGTFSESSIEVPIDSAFTFVVGQKSAVLFRGEEVVGTFRLRPTSLLAFNGVSEGSLKTALVTTLPGCP